jgi:hypothetical protein
MKDLRKLFDRAYDLWNSGDPRLDKHNRKAWIRAVIMLGDKWLLAKPIQRAEKNK